MAKTIYLVKKHPGQTGKHIEWIQMSGEEFAQFRQSPEGKGRFFIELTDDIDFECPDILIEVTSEEYLKWRKEYDHHRYIRSVAENAETLSLDSPLPEGGYIGDFLPSGEKALEELVLEQMQQEHVSKAVQQLSEADRRVIHVMFFGDTALSEKDAAKVLGVPKSTLHRWKKKIFRKIEKIMRTKS